MSKKIYESNMSQLVDAIDMCLGERSVMPCLILLYSAIDIMGSLSADNDKQRTTSSFKAWVNSYMLPGSNLRCTATDLYAARCGIVHSYSSESQLSKQGKAKMVWYAIQPAGADMLQERIDSIAELRGKAVAVQVETLVDAFKSGLKGFDRVVSRSRPLSTRVYGRAYRFFKGMSKESLEPRQEQSA